MQRNGGGDKEDLGHKIWPGEKYEGGDYPIRKVYVSSGQRAFVPL